MNILIPFSDYRKSAEHLYPGELAGSWQGRRGNHLGNQFWREGKTLISGGWPHHPASIIWKPYFYSLCDYLIEHHNVLQDIYHRSYPHILQFIKDKQATFTDTGTPPFVGNEDFHAAMRSNLLRKDKEKGWNWYCKFGWTESDDLPYIWPVC